MKTQLALGLPVNCLDGRAGHVSRLIFLPGGRKPAYVIVKVGRGPRQREITVPMSYVIETTSAAGELGLTRRELRTFPAYEAKVRSGDYPPPVLEQLGMLPTSRATKGYMVLRRRSVPDRAAEVRKGMPVRDSHGRAIGTVSNLIINRAHRQITHLVLRRARRGRDLRSVPAGLVAAVRDGAVYLGIPFRRADGLEVYKLKAG
jgi:sporulation protein YlmC with PRC-barrel domain